MTALECPLKAHDCERIARVGPRSEARRRRRVAVPPPTPASLIEHLWGLGLCISMPRTLRCRL